MKLCPRHLLTTLALSVAFLFAPSTRAIDDAPDRASLVELAKTWPYASTLEVDGNVDDILSLKPTRTEARVMLMQGYFESGFGKLTLGDCRCKRDDGTVDNCPNAKDRTIDKCSSFGVMQTVRPADWIPGATPAKVIKDRRLGYEVGLAVFRFTMRTCDGNVRSALGLYFSGVRCGAAPDAVNRRCKYIGC